MEALIDEAHKRKLETVAHLDPMGVGRMNTITAARLWYQSAETGSKQWKFSGKWRHFIFIKDYNDAGGIVTT